jgi:hypothetical protein
MIGLVVVIASRVRAALVLASLLAVAGCGASSTTNGTASNGARSSGPIAATIKQLRARQTRILEQAPNSASSYTDCASLGPVETLSDPTGDLKANFGNPPTHGYDGLDLTEAKLARSPTSLCVDMALRGAPAAHSLAAPLSGDDYSLTVTALSGGVGGIPSIKISFQLWSGGRWLVRLIGPGAEERPDHGFVAAQVGANGTQLSLVIPTSNLPRYLPLDTFHWRVQSLANGGKGIQFYDPVPDQVAPVYPPGTPPA